MEWISKNIYLTEEEMQNNALMVFRALYIKGWTIEAIAALLGNMESESTINPGIWENMTLDILGGYGLVQWTPSTIYTMWATSNDYDIADGDAQLLWIDTMTELTGQWIPTDEYPLSFAQFKRSTASPQYLASAFLKNFERAGVEVESERRTQASKWYNYMTNGRGSGGFITTKRKHYNFLLFGRRKRNAY